MYKSPFGVLIGVIALRCGYAAGPMHNSQPQRDSSPSNILTPGLYLSALTYSFHMSFFHRKHADKLCCPVCDSR